MFFYRFAFGNALETVKIVLNLLSWVNMGTKTQNFTLNSNAKKMWEKFTTNFILKNFFIVGARVFLGEKTVSFELVFKALFSRFLFGSEISMKICGFFLPIFTHFKKKKQCSQAKNGKNIINLVNIKVTRFHYPFQNWVLLVTYLNKIEWSLHSIAHLHFRARLGQTFRAK